MTETLERSAALAPRQNGNPQTALAAMAHRYQVSQEGLADVIKKTCIKGNCSDAEFRAFVLVANQYGLNPMTKEIHAFASGGAIVPIVGIDGWTKIINRHPEFDGCEFEEVKDGTDIGSQCTMYVKGRSHPIRITEWLSECKRNSPPWNTMKRRMLRHKSLIQAARIAFSLSGIYDEDEARDVVSNDPGAASAGASALNAKMVTSRPISEGQRLEVDPSAFRQDEPIVIEGEEVQAEPDVSGSDAEPSSQLSEEERFTIQARDAGDAAGIPREKIDADIAALLKLHGGKKRELAAVPAVKRQEFLASIGK